MDSKLKHAVRVDESGVTLRGIAPDHAEPNYTPMQPPIVYLDEDKSDALRFAARARVISTDGEVSCDRSRIYVSGATYAVIAMAAGTNYAGYQAARDRDVERVVEQLEEQLSAARGWDAALDAHIADYMALYGRVSIDLGEELTGALPADKRLASRHSGREPSGHLERQRTAAVVEQLHHQHKRGDELLAGRGVCAQRMP